MSDTTHISETVSAGQLRAFIERIERLEEEIKTANGDKSEVYKEARGCGFDVKAIRQCVAARKLDSAEREERNAIFDLYWSALTGSVHVHTPAREIIEEFDAKHIGMSGYLRKEDMPAHDPETGEITDTQEQPETADEFQAKVSEDNGSITGGAGAVAGETSRLASGRTDAGEAASADLPTNSPSDAASSDAATEPQAPQAVAAPLSDDDVPAFLKKDQPRKTAKDYRPHCQHPEACGASGLRHCYTCQKALDAEAVPA